MPIFLVKEAKKELILSQFLDFMEHTQYTVAVGLLFDKKVYLSQRVNTLNFAGKWQFAGGKLEENENPIDGGVREVKEETGLEISTNRLHYVVPITGDPTTYTCYIYVVKLNDAEVPQKMEAVTTEWKLFDFDEALRLDLMPGLPITLDILRGKNLI